MTSKMRAMMALFAGLAMTGDMSADKGRYYDPEDEHKPVKKVIPNGCKEYSFYGFTVIASNEKNARKKCKKLLDKI